MNAQSPSAEATVLNGIGRCAEALIDAGQLRSAVDELKKEEGDLAQFAATLFELECAKKGDTAAREHLSSTAEQLLTFSRDGRGPRLAEVHEKLLELWRDASSLLRSFEKARLERALTACFEARHDAALLQEALSELTPPGDRRVEFATCLFQLELARMGVDGARAEFAKRIVLVSEAYEDKAVATVLIGQNEGLQYLWKELIPYLDEFFESHAPPPAPELPPPLPGKDPDKTPTAKIPKDQVPFVAEGDLLTTVPTADEADVIESVEEPPPLPRTFSQDSELEVIELEEVPAAQVWQSEFDSWTGYEPDAKSQEFWRFTEKALVLLPSSEVARFGARAFSAEDRQARQKLNAWLDTASEQFAEVPDSKAMQCLMRLYMASQIKHRTLFGQANPKRKEAFRDALSLLSCDLDAAARATVWFELDGQETVEHLHDGLEVVIAYLQFCSLQRRDPLDASAVDDYLNFV